MFILADDLGYNEMGFMNETRGLITPNLDGLAKTGVVLKNYYVQPICSPTRSALMTGRYTIRLGTQANVIFWDTPWAISLQEKYVSEHLQGSGYDTAMFGKWHLGMFQEANMPHKRGFGEYEGYMQGCQSAYTHAASCCGAGSPTNDSHFACEGDKSGYLGYDWFQQDTPLPTANNTNSAYLIRDRAIEFLKQHDASSNANPFFLYLPFQNIHGPYTTEKKYRDLYVNDTSLSANEMTVFGYISELDDAVGDIMTVFKTMESYQNTVIIFSSDNGAPPLDGLDHGTPWSARNYPFRGHKTEIWEGGTRVAGFVHSPLLPEAVRGTQNHEHYHVTDWLPTILSLAELPIPDKLDGVNIWDSIAKKAPSPRSEHLYNVNPLCHGGQAAAPKAALRIGEMKVLAWCYNISGIDGATTTGPVTPAAGTKGVPDPDLFKGPLLYNLTADPAERVNLAQDDSHADVLSQLLARLEVLALESVEPMQWEMPYQGKDYFCANCSKHVKQYDPAQPWTSWY